jgi:hypothetical protein
VTLTADDTVTDDAPAAARRRRWSWLVALVAVLVLVGAGTPAVVYAHTYSPLGSGSFTGGPRGGLHGVTDGVYDPTRYVIAGPKGSTGSIAFSLANNGSHPVTILGSTLHLDATDAADISLAWSNPYDSNGFLVGAGLHPAHGFPTTIAPHQQIAVVVTITKPSCLIGGIREFTQIPLETLALRVHHVWNYPLGLTANDGLAPIDVCSPNAALRHLSKN